MADLMYLMTGSSAEQEACADSSQIAVEDYDKLEFEEQDTDEIGNENTNENLQDKWYRS